VPSLFQRLLVIHCFLNPQARVFTNFFKRWLKFPVLDPSGLAKLIPVAHARVFQELKDLVSDHQIGVIFDGTAYLGELFAMTFRFLHKDGIIHKAVMLDHSDSPLDTRRICGFVKSGLIKLNIPASLPRSHFH